jgi:hypothetical protein
MIGLEFPQTNEIVIGKIEVVEISNSAVGPFNANNLVLTVDEPVALITVTVISDELVKNTIPYFPRLTLPDADVISILPCEYAVKLIAVVSFNNWVVLTLPPELSICNAALTFKTKFEGCAIAIVKFLLKLKIWYLSFHWFPNFLIF